METTEKPRTGYKHKKIKYPDGDTTSVLKIRRIGSSRAAGSLYLSVENMKKMGLNIGDEIELFIRADKMIMLWKRE